MRLVSGRSFALKTMAILGFLMFGFVSAVYADLVDFAPGLLSFVRKRYGNDAIERLLDWQKLAKQNMAPASNPAEQPRPLRVSNQDQLDLSKAASASSINRFFNRVSYNTDQSIWGKADYWATPVEMLSVNAADCEDYAIAKYLSLKEIGVPVERLRITYVRALSLGVPHMVLAYYPTPDADPWIFDNLTTDIKQGSERPDLEPVFSFNDDDYLSGNGQVRRSGAMQIRLWKDLQEKLEREKRM